MEQIILEVLHSADPSRRLSWRPVFDFRHKVAERYGDRAFGHEYLHKPRYIPIQTERVLTNTFSASLNRALRSLVKKGLLECTHNPHWQEYRISDRETSIKDLEDKLRQVEREQPSTYFTAEVLSQRREELRSRIETRKRQGGVK